MTRRLLLAAVALGTASAQEAVRFELLLPDHFLQPVPSSAATVEVTPRPIQRLSVQVLEPAGGRGLSYGKIGVRVNGKGIGNIIDRRANARGKLLVMNAETLGMRPDQIFDPRENAIEVLAESENGRRYYQNWIVRVNESGRNELFLQTSALSPNDPDGVPPDLLLEEPSTPPVIRAGVASMKVRVRGKVTGAGTVLSLNGKPWKPAAAAALSPFDEEVLVARGQRELALEAMDKKGNRRTVVIPVVTPVPAAPKVRLAGNRYAVVVGISRFGAQKGAPVALRAAASDAGELAARLETQAGFPKENVRLLQDEKATLDQVKTALGEFAAKAKGDDLLVVYVATYGVHDPLRQENLYLAVHGTQMHQVDATALALSEVEAMMGRNVRCNRALLVFDVGRKLESPVKAPDKNLVNTLLPRLFADQEGWAVLASGSGDEVSLERTAQSDKPTGLFAHWVGEALSGQGDLNRDRVVTPDEMFRFVTERVRQESQGKQTPRYRLAGATAGMPLATTQ